MITGGGRDTAPLQRCYGVRSSLHLTIKGIRSYLELLNIVAYQCGIAVVSSGLLYPLKSGSSNVLSTFVNLYRR